MIPFNHPDFEHESVHFFSDPKTGLRAIIALHEAYQGRAGGGCRFYPYLFEEEALTDALRLSRAMTYKFVLADIPLGGAKSVIIGDPRTHKTEALLEAFGDCIARLNGRYTVGSDVGTNDEDMAVVRRQTPHVAGVKGAGGDTAPLTGYGVFRAIEAAWQFQHPGASLAGVRVAIQGLGGVGQHLAEHLSTAGAQLVVTDIDTAVLQQAQERGWEVVDPSGILFADTAIIAPCALGGVLTEESIPYIKASIVCGGANNQLAQEVLADQLQQRRITFVPDFVANAGGAISATGHLAGLSPEQIKAHTDGIYDTTLAILQEAASRSMTPLAAAYQLAKEKMAERA